MTKTDAKLLSALAHYSTCEIGDALVKLEYPNGGYIPDLEIYSPADKSQVKLVGEAFTVQMIDQAKSEREPKPEKHFVDAAEEGSIMVVSAPSHAKNAVWGGLMSAGAHAKKVQGVIVDGRVRDLSEHRSLGFPVFARGHSVLGQGNFTRPTAVQVPITLSAHPPTLDTYNNLFPAVTVEPQDIIVADEDGIVVFKPKDIEQVLEMCKDNHERDEKCMKDISSGRSIAETFREHRGPASTAETIAEKKDDKESKK